MSAVGQHKLHPAVLGASLRIVRPVGELVLAVRAWQPPGPDRQFRRVYPVSAQPLRNGLGPSQ